MWRCLSTNRLRWFRRQYFRMHEQLRHVHSRGKHSLYVVPARLRLQLRDRDNLPVELQRWWRRDRAKCLALILVELGCSNGDLYRHQHSRSAGFYRNGSVGRVDEDLRNDEPNECWADL